MSEERTVKGIVKAYAKQIKDVEVMGVTFYTVGVLVDEEWHNLQAEKKEQLEAFKNTIAPLNSEVEFLEYKKEGSKYWNYKNGSMTVLKKGDGVPQRRGGVFKPSYGQSKEYLEAKDRRITRLALLNTAIEFNKLAGTKGLSMDQLVTDAEALEQWVISKMTASGEVKDSEVEEEKIEG